MSKSKPSGAAHYELLFIISNRFTEDEAKKCVAKVENIITQGEGKISASEFWGKKRLAYPIKHETYGYYNLVEFDLERTALAKLEEKLRLDHEVLRHLIVIKKLKTDEQLQKEKKISEKISTKKAAVLKEQKTQEEKVAKDKVSKAKDKDKDKSDINSLDEKLEGILNANDLL
ncbi:MAG TPA: 30S ribosomal protein S6 [bacterium]|nr:30S ribosomal protein S6 [bacterium]HPT29483.1 30S ribosomal protein S6 [bacterium]